MLHAILSTGDGEDAAIGHLTCSKTFRQMLVIATSGARFRQPCGRCSWQGSGCLRLPPRPIRQARRYRSRRELTRALRLIARADLGLRSNPPSKRLVLETLVMDLTDRGETGNAGDGCRMQLPV